MEEVVLSENAFLGMIVASIEVYKNECTGVLLGYREGDRMTVDYALPYQSAKRGKTWVEQDIDRDIECLEELPFLSHLSHLGYFHSHTPTTGRKAVPLPSEEDLDSMDVGEIEIIIAINKSNRPRDWRINKNDFLSGATEKYSYEIGAYHLHEQKRAWKQVDIICPYAVGIGQAFLSLL